MSYRSLKRCPFCKHDGVVFSTDECGKWGHAACGGCGAQAPEVRTCYTETEWYADALDEWNTRAISISDTAIFIITMAALAVLLAFAASV